MNHGVVSCRNQAITRIVRTACILNVSLGIRKLLSSRSLFWEAVASYSHWTCSSVTGNWVLAPRQKPRADYARKYLNLHDCAAASTAEAKSQGFVHTKRKAQSGKAACPHGGALTLVISPASLGNADNLGGSLVIKSSTAYCRHEAPLRRS